MQKIKSIEAAEGEKHESDYTDMISNKEKQK